MRRMSKTISDHHSCSPALSEPARGLYFSRVPLFNVRHFIHFTVFPPLQEKKFECERCGKRFGSRSAHRIHLQNHTNKPFRCTQCGESYNSPEKLARHVVCHSSKWIAGPLANRLLSSFDVSAINALNAVRSLSGREI